MSIETLRILDKFFMHCRTLNLELLEGDKKYIRAISHCVPSDRLRSSLMGYVRRWQTAMLDEEDFSRKQGTGRRAANLYLQDSLK